MALLLLGISFGASMYTIGPRRTVTQQQTAVSNATEKVHKAILAFVSRQFRLPCPADGTKAQGTASDGLETFNGTGCTVTGNTGVVPWKTLGLTYTDALDGWKNRLGYAVTASLATGTPYKRPSGDQIDGIQVALDTGSGASSTNLYAYVLINYGPDGAGATNLAGTQIAPTTAQKATNEYANTLSSAYAGTTPFAVWPTNTVSLRANGTANGINTAYFDDSLYYEASPAICNELDGALKGSSKATYCKSNNTSIDNGQTITSPDDLPANSGFGSLSTSSAGGSGATLRSSATIMTPSGTTTPIVFMGAVQNSGSGATLTANSSACTWANELFPWTTQTLRAYFEFAPSYDGATTFGEGVTFAILPAGVNVATQVPCGENPGASTVEGDDVGFVGIQNGTQALAAASVSSVGSVNTVTITSAGSGYTSAPTVAFSAAPSGGTTATGTATIAGEVASITVENGQSGYTAQPTVTIAAPTGTGGTTATATAFLVLASISVTGTSDSAGSGYTSAPTVTISGGGGSGATATATIYTSGTNRGQIESITITSAGSSYTSVPSVSFSGGGGSGAVATASMAVGSISMVSDGSGYTAAPKVAIAASSTGNFAAATANVSNTVTAVTFSGGDGYTTAPTISFSGGNGSGAAATATISASAVNNVTMTSTGSGYMYLPTVEFGGTSTGSTASALVTTMGVSAGDGSIVVTNMGVGYNPTIDGLPTVTITQPGCGTSCATATVDSMSVTGVDLTNTGSGYGPTIQIDAPGGAGTTATAVATVSEGVIETVTVTNGGSGYTSAPNVSFPGATGVTATGTATIDSAGAVTGITVNSGGSGYGPAITVSPTNGETITNPAVIIPSVDSTGAISGLTIEENGSGYTANPSITIALGTTTNQAAALVSSMGLTSIDVAAAGSGYTSIPAVTISPPATCLLSACTAASAAATVTIQSVQLSSGGSGYAATPTVVIAPPVVLPKLAIEFNTDASAPDFTEEDPYYNNYGYNGGLTSPTASTTTQDLTGIRHDVSAEYLTTDVIDTLYHDDTYRYSTSTSGGAQSNTAYTVSSSCDSGAGYSSIFGGYAVGGAAGGCSYTSGTQIITSFLTTSNEIPVTQNGVSFNYHPVRIEAQRYCNSDCSSCGNTGTSGDVYILTMVYLDCTSAGVGGNACNDLTQNLLIGSFSPSTAGGYFPLTTGQTYSSANTVNYCTLDPGSASPMAGQSAMDNVIYGLTTAAGTNAVTGGIMYRNLQMVTE